MRIPSGTTDQFIYFVAVDSTDFTTRETGLTTFTVYRSRNGAAAVAMTTPTINETDLTNMPGVYELLVDEDMTLDAGNDSEEVVYHITQASMAPVTRTIEIYRPKFTEGSTLSVTDIVSSGAITTSAGSITTVSTVTSDVGVDFSSVTLPTGEIPSLGIIDNGTMQSATSTTLVLRAASSFSDDSVIGSTVVVSGGTGAGQSRLITDYVSSTDTITVDAWTTTPTGDYVIVGTPPSSSSSPISVNVTQVSGVAEDLPTQSQNTSDFTATQDLVSNISVGSGGLGTTSSSATITTGTETNTFSVTEQADGTLHEVAASGGNTEFFYEFDVTSQGVATSIVWDGYIQSNSDTVEVQGFDWVSSSYKTMRTLVGSNGTSISEQSFKPTVAMTGTGANAGLFRLRFLSTTSTNVATDRIIAEYTGLLGGIPNGSTVTLASTTANQNLEGTAWNLALGGQDVGSSYFKGCFITGTSTNAVTAPPVFDRTSAGTVSLSSTGFLIDSTLSDTLTLTSTATATEDNFIINNCFSGVVGTGSPTIDLSGVTKTTNLQNRGWYGGVVYAITSDCLLTHESVRGGDVVLTNVGGTADIRGQLKTFTVTSSSTATTNLVCDSSGTITVNGSAGTVNIHGSHGSVVDNSGGAVTINDLGQDLTDVASIKSTTDQMVFTKANELDTNTLSINGAGVIGDGNTTPWDGA